LTTRSRSRTNEARRPFHHRLLAEQLVVRRLRERLLADVQGDLDAIVLVAVQLEVLEAHGDVLFADAEEAADADQRGDDLAATVGDEIVDVSDGLILAVDRRLADDRAGKHVVSRLLLEELTALRGALLRRHRLRSLSRLIRRDHLGAFRRLVESLHVRL
jgi:hypothetical protein